MIDDPFNPYGDGLSTIGAEPSDDPPDNGWWEFWNGVWRWVTAPAPVVVSG